MPDARKVQSARIEAAQIINRIPVLIRRIIPRGKTAGELLEHPQFAPGTPERTILRKEISSHYKNTPLTEFQRILSRFLPPEEKTELEAAADREKIPNTQKYGNSPEIQKRRMSPATEIVLSNLFKTDVLEKISEGIGFTVPLSDIPLKWQVWENEDTDNNMVSDVMIGSRNKAAQENLEQPITAKQTAIEKDFIYAFIDRIRNGELTTEDVPSRFKSLRLLYALVMEILSISETETEVMERIRILKSHLFTRIKFRVDPYGFIG